MSFLSRRNSPSSIRPLRADRSEECAAIHASAFAHSWDAAEFTALLTGSSTIGSAALDPATNRLRGFALSRLAADEAEVLTIAVDPAERKRGVGRDLLREHLQQATLAGARALFLEVDAENAAAIALYHRFGFAQVASRVGYYRRADGKPATALVMRRDLK
jgi:[ribosomal protein S18]-alanine N-acetyltransferase